MSALDVRCPACERKPGYPCMDLRGVLEASMWTEDTQKGGLAGYGDVKTPHRERRDLANRRAIIRGIA